MGLGLGLGLGLGSASRLLLPLATPPPPLLLVAAPALALALALAPLLITPQRIPQVAPLRITPLRATPIAPLPVPVTSIARLPAARLPARRARLRTLVIAPTLSLPLAPAPIALARHRRRRRRRRRLGRPGRPALTNDLFHPLPQPRCERGGGAAEEGLEVGGHLSLRLLVLHHLPGAGRRCDDRGSRGGREGGGWSAAACRVEGGRTTMTYSGRTSSAPPVRSASFACTAVCTTLNWDSVSRCPPMTWRGWRRRSLRVEGGETRHVGAGG